MITIFNKPSTVVVDCFTSRADVYNLHPIDYAIKFLPEWWKNLPAFEETSLAPRNTMKKCRGFIDLYDKSIMLPMWSDLIIRYNANELEYQFADSISEISKHDYSQRLGFLPNNLDIKIISPWIFKTKEEINWMTVKPMYNYPNSVDFDVYHGVVNFKYQCITNINLFFPQTIEIKKINFEAGQPIWHLLPMTEKNIVIKTHLISHDELVNKRYETGKVKFIGSYNYSKKIIKEKESKCPFSGLFK